LKSSSDLKVSYHPQHIRQSIHLRPYLERTPKDPMKRLLLAALTAVTLLTATTASAHHDWDHKHQDTATQAGSKR
jgi:hypothetical protein